MCLNIMTVNHLFIFDEDVLPIISLKWRVCFAKLKFKLHKCI